MLLIYSNHAEVFGLHRHCGHPSAHPNHPIETAVRWANPHLRPHRTRCVVRRFGQAPWDASDAQACVFMESTYAPLDPALGEMDRAQSLQTDAGAAAAGATLGDGERAMDPSRMHVQARQLSPSERAWLRVQLWQLEYCP
jgi:hypothetical protein